MELSILDNAQTYVGVLATFIVLCLFAEKGQETGNFIIFTMLKIAKDYNGILSRHITRLKKDIYSVFGDSDVDTEQNETTRFVESVPDHKLKGELKTTILAIRKQSNQFALDARKLMTSMDSEHLFKDKEELPFIALFTLLLIITVLFVDCIDLIPIKLRCEFVNILLASATVYSILLYRKFMAIRGDLESVDSGPMMGDGVSPTSSSLDRNVQGKKVKIFLWLSLAFVSWIALGCTISVAWVGVLLMPVVMYAALFMMKRRWIRAAHIYNRYNRLFILKHFTYLFLFTILSVAAVNIASRLSILWFSEIYKMNWSGITGILSDKQVCKVFIILFFTLNGIILPLCFGFIYLTLKKRKVLSEIEASKNRYKNDSSRHFQEFNELKHKAEKINMTIPKAHTELESHKETKASSEENKESIGENDAKE